MRKLGYGIAVLVLFVGRAPGWNPPQPPATFNLTLSSSNATDIVVTDANGCVLECWRGELKPGDTVRLGPGRLAPANALPWEYLRLRPARSLSPLYRMWDADRYALHARMMRYYRPATFDPLLPPLPLPPGLLPTETDGAEADLRLVLFLRKEGTSGPGAVWMPAAAPPTAPRKDVGGRFSGTTEGILLELERRRFMSSLPTDANCDFTTSVAAVEGGRVVALREPTIRFRINNFNCWEPQETVLIAQTLKELKDEVLRLPPDPKK
jgi:hypothetical protein